MGNLGVAGVIAFAVVLGMAVLLWVRGKRLGGPVGRIDLRRGFPRTRRAGYAVEDVEALLDHAYQLSGDAEGRATALEELHEAQFEVARRGGYDPVVVDLHVDAMITALQTGRDLPPRPGGGRGE